MGYYTVGCGLDHPQGTYIFTNVVEKPWKLSAAMTHEFVSSALPPAADRQRISWWSDVGTHFRSYCLLTWVATFLMGLLKVDMDYNYGPEQHFKNQVDGMFGWLRGAIARISKEHILLTIDDLIKWLREEHEESVKFAEANGEPRPMDRIFLKLDPELRAKHHYESLCFTQWPAGIKSTHFWKFEWNDVRRRRKGSIWSDCGFYASAIRVKGEGVRLVNRPMIKAMNAKQINTKYNTNKYQI